jgi:hypothetical protein
LPKLAGTLPKWFLAVNSSLTARITCTRSVTGCHELRKHALPHTCLVLLSQHLSHLLYKVLVRQYHLHLLMHQQAAELSKDCTLIFSCMTCALCKESRCFCWNLVAVHAVFICSRHCTATGLQHGRCLLNFYLSEAAKLHLSTCGGIKHDGSATGAGEV